MLLKIGRFAFSKLLLSTATQELPDQFTLVIKTLLVTQEVALGCTVAADAKVGVLDVVGPIKLDVHVVLAWL